MTPLRPTMNRPSMRRRNQSPASAVGRVGVLERLERRVLLASISGTQYNDLNNNGGKNAGEAGLPGWIVYLDTGTIGSYDGTAVVSTDVPKNISDSDTISSNLTVSGFAGTVADVNVTINFSHTWDADLDAYLIGPLGTHVKLFGAIGSSGDNFTNTTLDDESATAIGSSTAPFTGYFRPAQPLSAFDGLGANGTWVLEVSDNAPLDVGTIDSWSLQFNSAEISTTTDKNGNYALTGLAAGTYSVNEILKSGWTMSQPASGLYTINLPSGSSTSTGNHFGVHLPPGNIRGHIFSDNNGDGDKDSGETFLSGWTVYLDTNNNAVKDAGEPSTLTGAAGDYAFDGIAPQQYVVRTQVPAGYAQSSPVGGAPLSRTIAPASSSTIGKDRTFTNTEVVANIASRQSLAALSAYLRGNPSSPLVRLIDLARSRQILSTSKKSAMARIALRGGADPQTTVKLLNELAIVKWASPNYRHDSSTAGDPREFTPNDPQYASQWHHTRMQNNLAWDTTPGSSSLVVAITDDGADWAHPDLAAGIWNNPGEISGNGIDDDANGYIDDVRGWDFWGDDNNPTPISGDTHGTHTTGIVGARTNNAVGVSGTAGGVSVMPIKFFGDSGNVWTSALIAQAYAYAADNGAKIVSTSYNIDDFADDAVFAAGLQYLYDQGVLHFNSAGNNSQLNPPRQKYDQSLFVASTGSSDLKSSFSNYGWGIDISAPGENILSTYPNNSYATISGTSMATPNAAAAAALIWSAHPTWTRDQVAAQLIGSADNIDALNPSYAGMIGSGRANSYKGVTTTLAGPKFRLNSLTGLPANGSIVSVAPSSFTLDVASVFAPSTMNNGNNWTLTGDGADNAFGTSDDVNISLTLNTNYMIGTNRLSFTIGGAASMPPDTYRFTAGAGLTDPFGTVLDGNGDGIAGDAFTRTFTLTGIATPIVVILQPDMTFASADFAEFPTAYAGSDFTLRIDTGGSNVQVWVDSSTANPPNYSADRAIISSMSFAGTGGDDTLTLDYTNGYPIPNSGLTFTAGAGNDTLKLIGTTNPDSATFNASSITFNGTIGHSGVESILFDGAAGGDNVIINAGPSVQFTASQQLVSLAIATAATASVAAGGNHLLFTQSLSLASSAKLDLNDNDLILDYTVTSPLDTIQGLVSSARNGGAWNGDGITSTSARDNPAGNSTLGLLEASDYLDINGPSATFDGESLDSTMVLIKYTYNGDADFNGMVNFDDYSRIDLGFNTQTTPGFAYKWLVGNFDFNNSINFDDYSLIDLAFNTQAGQL